MQPTDLRSRLQQRRERIAAGQPIPDAVTMTARDGQRSHSGQLRPRYTQLGPRRGRSMSKLFFEALGIRCSD